MLIYNGRIWPMDGSAVRKGWILTEAGKIVSMGDGEASPDYDGEMIDAQEGYILPGLVDPHSHLGLCEDSLGFEGDDLNEDTDPVTPHLRALDGINPADIAFSEALEAGVTTVVVSPGSANPVGGQTAAIKTGGRRIDDMVIRAPLSVKFALGENPKTVYHGKSAAPVTRMAVAALIRTTLSRAQEYARKIDRSVTEGDEEAPDFDPKLEALLPLLRGEVSAHFHAHRADDIFTAIRIAGEFHLKYAIVHATEAHLIADILQREGVRLITGPALTAREKPELHNLVYETPGITTRSGLLTAICTDHPVIPEKHLLLCAALAHKAGMGEEDALAAVTINAAMIAGIDDRVGSLSPGKDADIAVFGAHPLRLESKVTAVILDGRRVY